MELTGRITILKSSRDTITVRLRDESSRFEFAEIELTPHDFCMALTGLAEVKGALTCRGLEHVGKQRVTEQRSIVCPLATYTKREELSKWLEENAKEDGWILNTYLGAQSSVLVRGDVMTLRYSVSRYVSRQQS